MQIALIMLDRRFGGIQKVFVNYSIELYKRNYPVLCVIRENALVADLLRQNDVNSISELKNRTGFYDSLAIRDLKRKLTQFFSNDNPCFILTFDSRSTYFAGKARSNQFNWKIVASLPNSVNFKYYKFADVLVPSTKDMAKATYHKNLVNPNFSDVIPLFCRVKPAKSAPKLTEIVNLACAGRFVSKKGFDVLLEAISILKKDYPQIFLRIAGDGPEQKRLMQLCSQLELEETVEFLGYHNDVPELINSSDLLVVPSAIEPFGIIFLEGMATGTAIVTTRSSGAMNTLDETTAVFADIGSPKSLADAISYVIENPDCANTRAAKALEEFKRHYTPDAVISKMIELLKNTS